MFKGIKKIQNLIIGFAAIIIFLLAACANPGNDALSDSENTADPEFKTLVDMQNAYYEKGLALARNYGAVIEATRGDDEAPVAPVFDSKEDEDKFNSDIASLNAEFESMLDNVSIESIELPDGEVINPTGDVVTIYGQDLNKHALTLMAQADESPVNGRGLRLYATKLWPGGKVRYAFQSSVPECDREEIRKVMAEINEKTDGEIKFTEISLTAWNKLTYYTGTNIFLMINKYDVVGAANALPGYFPFSSFNLDKDFSKEEDEDERLGTIRHELGHVLGLQHEHQRPDRDKYITVDWNEIQNDLYIKAQYISFPKDIRFVKKIRIRINFFGIKIYKDIVLYDYNVKISQMLGTYDYDSVMHYCAHSGFGKNYGIPEIYRKGGKIKWGYKYDNLGSNVYSPTDIRALKTLY